MKSLSEYLKNFCITEMAIKLGEFRNNSEGIINQIIQNWCLVRWCDENMYDNISIRLRNHWASELKTNMLKISNAKLKGNRKDKVINNLVIKTLEYDDMTNIARIIRNKFAKEGLSKYINSIAFECAENINKICNIISNGTKSDIDDYIQGYLM